MLKNNNIYFLDDTNNYDVEQSLDMIQKKNSMINNLHKTENRDINSKAKDYLGFLNNADANIFEIDSNNTDNTNNTNNINNINNIKNSNNTNNLNNSNSSLKDLIDKMVTILYLIMMGVLIVSVFFKNSNFIFQLLVVNLLFIFIKIFLKIYY